MIDLWGWNVGSGAWGFVGWLRLINAEGGPARG